MQEYYLCLRKLTKTVEFIVFFFSVYYFIVNFIIDGGTISLDEMWEVVKELEIGMDYKELRFHSYFIKK